ncbi:MAG TPA: methylenetetrahydrofolate--tRNA-(uracil(54)-C(5))-methyltransferase (FADH(2)-oxidizing) TrmFO [Acholeplasmataceae bacterium]|nr:methylenetetrahydrofolate--tRNA-(uracil(54)-C(5))-methyltransferase (FADH(2)-oxidizing) TrmFO [Acholeplasmataceae bacterium]
MKVNVIGAGLAGSEAAWQLAKRGIGVRLYEMRPKKYTEAHRTGEFAELICSNSLRSASLENAVGLLKAEMRKLDSLIMRAADATRIEAGSALAVDRQLFSRFVTGFLSALPEVEIIRAEVKEIPEGPTIIATGPLTSQDFAEEIRKFCGEDYLYFFDAVAPIVTEESINKEIAYLKSRYDKGEAAYYNCPMTREQFDAFYEALINAERVTPHDFEMKVFEGCMAIEEMAARGRETLLFGPMKPVGLADPRTGKEPYAVVQLRQDDAAKTMYNIVGFQTSLKFPEQKRLFRMIPGLENCEIVRYGVMHRNTYINSPKVLNRFYQTNQRKDLFFAGQITGVEGYLESAASGLVAGLNMARYLEGKPLLDFTRKTAIGALANYISSPNKNFQPMNVNFGIFESLEGRLKKAERKRAYAERSMEVMEEVLGEENEGN